MARAAAAPRVASSRSLPSDWLLNPSSLLELARPRNASEVFPVIVVSGAAGSGRATLAWAWGCALNCGSRTADGGACGTCRSCRRLLDGQHPDLLHLAVDEGSQGVKVEQVRALQERLDYRPFEALWRLVVIDRADTMSETAANCLLKTLEEPPEQTVFALLTTNHAQLLPTIHSRSRIYKLLPIDEGRLTAWLVQQGHGAAPSRLAARLSEGAPGQALTRLEDKSWWALREQALQTWSAVSAGQTGPGQLADAADTLTKANAGPAGRTRLLDHLGVGVTWFRDGLLLSQGASAEQVLNIDRKDELVTLSRSHASAAWLRAIDTLVEARLQVAGYVNARMAFTLAYQQIREAFVGVSGRGREQRSPNH